MILAYLNLFLQNPKANLNINFGPCILDSKQPPAATSAQHRNTANMQGWLSVVVGGIKSDVTKYANRHHIVFGWQPRFHDHIIRQTDEMNRIAEYIETNVLRWESDEFYS